MEFTIKKIVSIDKDAEKYRKNMEDNLSVKRNDLNLLVERLNADAQSEIDEIKKEIMNKYLDEANCKVEKIRAEKEEEIKKIHQSYNKIKNNIINEVFDEVINSI